MLSGPDCVNRRIILTEQQAIEIYLKNPGKREDIPNRKYESQSRLLSEQYGVSPKAVRDIWNRKTWVYATQHLSPLSQGSVTSSKVQNMLV